jgi:glycosyltransferase involved in cell wall biosynthesis
VIAISVVIPTHNRARLLAKHLLQLKDQSLPPEQFEVIVVADGCMDDTATILRGLALPYRLTVLEQTPRAGASAARNRGAEAAQADVLLFLDDDMEPRAGLLRAHLNAQQAMAGGVVVGYFPMQAPQKGESVFTKATRLWWADRFHELALPNHRFSLKDFCTGNVSLVRRAFHNAGGFDEAIGQSGAGEDYELGYRLLKNKVLFQYAPAAETLHASTSSWDATLQRAREEGYGQAIIVQRHPELLYGFNTSRLSRLSDSILLRPLWVAIWRYPVLARPAVAAVRMIARIFLSLNVQSLFWKLQEVLRGHAYWIGLRNALGSLSAWERLAQDAPYQPENLHEVDFDVSRDLIALDDFMQEHAPVDAMRVFVSGQPIGRIPPRIGAEPLRAQHVRALLVERFAPVLLGELVSRKGFCCSPTLGVLAKPARQEEEVNDSECQSISGAPRFPR